MSRVFVSLQGLFTYAEGSATKAISAEEARSSEDKVYTISRNISMFRGSEDTLVTLTLSDLRFPHVETFLEKLKTTTEKRGMGLKNIQSPYFNLAAAVMQQEGGVCTAFDLLSKWNNVDVSADNIGSIIFDTVDEMRTLREYKNALVKDLTITDIECKAAYTAEFRLERN